MLQDAEEVLKINSHWSSLQFQRNSYNSKNDYSISHYLSGQQFGWYCIKMSITKSAENMNMILSMVMYYDSSYTLR